MRWPWKRREYRLRVVNPGAICQPPPLEWTRDRKVVQDAYDELVAKGYPTGPGPSWEWEVAPRYVVIEERAA